VREWLDENQRKKRLTNKISRRVYFWNSTFQSSELHESDLEYAFRYYGVVEEVFIKRMKLKDLRTQGKIQAYAIHKGNYPESRELDDETKVICYGFCTFRDLSVTEDLLKVKTCKIKAVEIILHSCEEYQKLCQPIYSNKAPTNSPK
jgi:hypothetical protein